MPLQAAGLMTKYAGYLRVQATRRFLSNDAKMELRQHAPWANLVAACTLLHVNGQGRRLQVVRNLEQVSSMSCFVRKTAARSAVRLSLVDCALPSLRNGPQLHLSVARFWAIVANGTPIWLAQATPVLATH